MKLYDIRLPHMWRKMRPIDIARNIKSKDRLKSITLEDFVALVGDDDVLSTLEMIYSDMNSEFIKSLTRALETGNTRNVRLLLRVAKRSMKWDVYTNTQAKAFVTDLKIRPSKDDVIASMGELGYEWSSGQQLWLPIEEQ